MLRTLNAYGHRMHPSKRWSRNWQLYYPGDVKWTYPPIADMGSEARIFCYLDDLIEGMLRTMEAPTGFAGPVSLGIQPNMRWWTCRMGSATSRIKRQSNSRPLPLADLGRRQTNIALAKP